MAIDIALNDALRGIVEHQGRNLLDDPDRCAQALADAKLSPEDIAGLMAAVKEGVPKRLLRTAPPRITPDTVTGLAHGLANSTHVSLDQARQSVEAWAYALRVEVSAPPTAEPAKPEAPAIEQKAETFNSQAPAADQVQSTPPPPTNLPKPPLKIKAALLTPLAAIVGGIAGIVVFGIYYVATLLVLNLLFQHHLSGNEIGEIAGQTSAVMGLPCGVLGGMSWIELRYRYDWLGWTVAGIVALVLALYPFVHGIGQIFMTWAQFGAFGIVALFGVLGIAGKLSEIGAKRRT
ncbi:MAG TPA: hypothetical protein VG839_05470 [Asticcacaulis sp.]|nr:hypothetical protein [Asticcacaulis sp.]